MPHPGFGRPDDAASLRAVTLAASSLATLVSRDCRLTPTRSGIIASSGLPRPGRLMTCPGTPMTTELDGTSLTTTALAPIRLSSPILIGAEDLGPGADDHAVADGGVAFPGIRAAAAERDAVEDRDVLAHLGGFSDHHAGRVVDEQPRAEDRRRGGSRRRSGCG